MKMIKLNFFHKFKSFLQESWLEIKKVNWPSKRETIKYTLVVLLTLTITALFLGGVDFIFTRFLNKFIF
jgi:preprotein translocase subunit SecE